MAQITCEELNSVWVLQKLIARERQHLTDLEIFTGTTTQILDGMPHAKPLTYKVEKIATLLLETKKRIEQLTSELVQCKFDLLTSIQSQHLPEIQERIICYHYVACLKYGEIAKLMSYTREYIWKIHNKAIVNLGLRVEDMIKCKKATNVNAIRFAVNFDST